MNNSPTSWASLQASLRHEDEINRRLSEALGYEVIGSWSSRYLMMDIDQAVEELKEDLEPEEGSVRVIGRPK